VRGLKSSFTSILMPSAMPWNSPSQISLTCVKGMRTYARLAPMRSDITAACLRSTQVRMVPKPISMPTA
jgi:hypothetical protein